jgi:hypothetical protein
MTIHVANITPVTLAVARRTLLQIIAGTQPLRIKEIGISFNGTDAAQAPIQVDLQRQNAAGTASVTAGVPSENQEVGPTALATWRGGFSSTEPTSADTAPLGVLRTWYVTPAGGLFVMQFPLGDEPVVGSSGRLALIADNAAGTATCKAAAYIVFDE